MVGAAASASSHFFTRSGTRNLAALEPFILVPSTGVLVVRSTLLMDAMAQQLLARLRQNPTDSAALSALSAHCEQMGDYALLVDAMEQHARALAEADGDPIELGRIHFDLGNLFRARMGRADRAIVHYRAAIDYDAAQRPAMAAARAIYTELGKWDQVAKLLTREAESLPPGQKRATVLKELSSVYRDRLGQFGQATQALREAAAADAEDLQIRHDLATVLLDQADREMDANRADSERREAADVLCEMAGAVSDDYAFAYIEAALDAVPDHGQGLALLEEVAPRVGRADTIPPRWVAGLQMAPLGPLSRDLRLKLAHAYRDVGQLEDARACLDPLLQAHDGEAQAFAESLSMPPKKLDLAGPTGEVSLDDVDLIEAESSIRLDLASDLAALAARDQEHDDRSSRSLDDLAVVQSVAPPGSVGVTDEAVQMLSSVEMALPPEDESAALDDEDEAEPSAEGDLHGEATKPRASLLPLRPSRDVGVSPSSEADLSQTPQVPLAPADLTAGQDDAQGSQAADPSAAQPVSPAPTTTSSAPEAQRDAEAAPLPVAPLSELAKLRVELAKKLRFRDSRGAAEIAETILGHDPTDADAIRALEDHYRSSRDFRRMRELAMRIGKEPAMAVEIRLERLREAAMLSESKLGDVEGTIAAWRALVALAPDDEESRIKLRKLLTRQQRWDELSQVLDTQARSIVDEKLRADAYRELVILHRDKRKNLADAIETMATVRDLAPDHAADEILLSELLLAAERFAEATSAFEARLARAATDQERLTLLRVLADLYETRLADDERAYEICSQILREIPDDEATFDRMERIDERQARFDRLLKIVLARADNARGAARVALLTRSAEIARTKTQDLARSADLYGDALELAPGDPALTDAAEIAFDEAGRSQAFTDLLAQHAAVATEKDAGLFLQRKVAARLVKGGDLDAAITAHEALLALEVEVGTLRSLVTLLERADGRELELAQHLDALAQRVEAGEARDLRFSRASLLANRLNDPEGAKNELRTILKTLAPGDTATLELLIQLGTSTGDNGCIAEAQEQQLLVATDDEVRVDLARSLADVYEGPLADRARAIAALDVWASLDLVNPQAYLRLVPLLEAERKFPELRTTLDTLATLSIADDEAAHFLLRAAKIAMHELADYEGAWQRLVPRVVDAGDAQAEELLRELAQLSGRGEQLAQLFVGLAQRGDDDQEQIRRWTDAARVYEVMVGSVDKALEAALRALAKDMSSVAMLGEVDRLAAAANAWPRLAQVYDALARRGEDVDARVGPLLRHASLLEHKAGDLSAAFDRVALAFSLDPSVDDVYADACRLGQASGRTEDWLAVHERRALEVSETSQKIDALIEACRIAQQVLEDSPRATGALSRAVGLAGSDGGTLDKIEQMVKMLDESQPPLDGRGLTHALCEVYELRAEEGRDDPKLAAELLRRAAILLEVHQGKRDAAYRSLERAAALSPTDESILDALVSLAARAQTVDALTKHFVQASHDAIDSTTASVALRRLGHLYETTLASPDKAAEVYSQLVMLRPRDVDVADKLRACLKAAGQFKELLVAIDRQLALVATTEERQPLLEEAAEVWETGVKNRFEARDAWKKVATQFPSSVAASAALARLEVKAVLDESDLLEGDLVVRPEDLRPTDPPVFIPAPTAAAQPVEVTEPDVADTSVPPPPDASLASLPPPPDASLTSVPPPEDASLASLPPPEDASLEGVAHTQTVFVAGDAAPSEPVDNSPTDAPEASADAESVQVDAPESDDDDEDAQSALADQARAYADESHDTDPPSHSAEHDAAVAEIVIEIEDAADYVEEADGYTTATEPAPARFRPDGSDFTEEISLSEISVLAARDLAVALTVQPSDTDPGELAAAPTRDLLAGDLLAGMARSDAQAEELAKPDGAEVMESSANLFETEAVQLESGADQADSESVEPGLDEEPLEVQGASLDMLSNMLERGAIKAATPTKSRVPPPPPRSAQSAASVAPPARPSVPPPPLPRGGGAPPLPEPALATVPLVPDDARSVPPAPGTIPPPLPGSVPPRRDS